MRKHKDVYRKTRGRNRPGGTKRAIQDLVGASIVSARAARAIRKRMRRGIERLRSKPDEMSRKARFEMAFEAERHEKLRAGLMEGVRTYQTDAGLVRMMRESVDVVRIMGGKL